MKKLLSNVCMFMIMSCGMLFTACSSDSDDGNGGNGGNIETPKYAADAIRLTIEDTQCAYSQIEFTESGNYIITKQGYTALAKSTSFIPEVETTRASLDGYIYGKYTKNGDVYTLEGFGTISVSRDQNSTATIQIQEPNKEPYTATAKVAEFVSDSEMTRKICRTWEITKVELKVIENGKVVEDFSGTIQDYYKKQGADNYPTSIIFSRAGTYLVTYNGGKCMLSAWGWKDESKGIFYYDKSHSSNIDKLPGATVTFEGSILVVSEEHVSHNGEESETMKTYLREMKY